MRKMATERRAAFPLLVERALSIITVLGLVCMGIGLLLYITGNASNVFFFAQIGAIVLSVGTLLVGIRVFSWLVETIVGKGLERGLDAETGRHLSGRAGR